MKQLNIGNLVNWIEDCTCKLCPEKATWLDTKSGYCDKCFPNYSELGIDRKKFLRKKEKKGNL